MLLCAAPHVVVVAQDVPILFRDVHVFDGTRSLGARDVLVRNGKVDAIGVGLTAPAGATVIAGDHKTLLPGLIDAHTHSWGDALVQGLAFGVTTSLDMFTEPKQAATWREEQRDSRANGRSDIVSSGILVTAPGGHGTEYGMAIPTIASPDSAQSFVDARIAEGSDYIKIVYDDGSAYGFARLLPTLDTATMGAVIRAAHRRGKLAVVHIGTADGARAALDAGADGLVHTYADADVPDIATLARRHNAFVIPTLTVNMSVSGTPGTAALLKVPRVDSAVRQTEVDNIQRAFPRRPTSRIQYAFSESSVVQLKRAGVPILAGTDAPNPGTAHGVSLHRELELLVQAGLTPTEALAAATSVPARIFALAGKGAIAPGSRADLLLVEGDPTRDITATRNIVGIWKNGVRFDRDGYVKRALTTRSAAANVGAPPKGSESGDVSNFDDGTTAARFGAGWDVSTDRMAGGRSTAKIDVVDGGANASAKSLLVSGTIDGAMPYAWAGAMFTPGSAPMTPANLSAKKEIRFWARGDGKTYRVMLFAQSKGMMPLIQPFVSTADWKEYVFPLRDFGTDARDLLMLLISAGPEPGSFSLRVDDVRFR